MSVVAQLARHRGFLSLALAVACLTRLAAGAESSAVDLRGPSSLYTQTGRGTGTAKGALFTPEDTAFSAAVRKRQHSEEDECQAYLLKHQAVSDRSSVGAVFLNRNIELALHARRASTWAAKVPFDIFQEFVLPYASLTERREGWRRLFFQELLPQVSNAKTLTEATSALNQYIWGRWRITLKADQKPEIMSPYEVIKTGKASATGLSIFLVNALRSVGIPSRLVGTPQWKQGDGAHTWVEAWDNGAWSFYDPAEYRPVNDSWFFPQPAKFQVPGSDTFAIFALTVACETPASTPAPWVPEDRSLCGVDITQAYVAAASDPKLSLASSP